MSDCEWKWLVDKRGQKKMARFVSASGAASEIRHKINHNSSDKIAFDLIQWLFSDTFLSLLLPSDLFLGSCLFHENCLKAMACLY